MAATVAFLCLRTVLTEQILGRYLAVPEARHRQRAWFPTEGRQRAYLNNVRST